MKWKNVPDLGVIAAVYNEVLQLAYVDELLDLIRREFMKKVYPTLENDQGYFIRLPDQFDKHFTKILSHWETKMP